MPNLEVIRGDGPALSGPPAPPKEGAIYLVSHGAYREPRFVELQHIRILRYIEALNEHCEGEFRPRAMFVDVLYPRSDYIAELPNLTRLLADIEAGAIDTVFMDLEVGRPYTPSQNRPIVDAIERAGAKVYNAFYDDGGAIVARVQSMFSGGYPLAFDGPSDVDDVITLFPGLAARVARVILDRIVPTGAQTIAVRDLERTLHRLGDENPYRTSRLPLLSAAQHREMSEWAAEVHARPGRREPQRQRPR